MTTMPAASEPRPRRSRWRRGFTLAETIIAVAVGGMVMSAVTGTFVFFVRNSIVLTNYTQLNQRGRSALEVLARDLRMTEVVNTMTATTLEVQVPRASGRITVSYRWDSRNQALYRRDDDGERLVLRGVTQFEFQYTGLRGGVARTPLECKKVQVDAVLEDNVQSRTQTQRILSAAFTLRNRAVAS